MKREVAIILFLLSMFRLSAQTDTPGIYKTWKDYNAGVPNYPIACNSANDKIRLHHFLARNYMDIINAGSKTQFYKDSIFAYTDCKQNTYRFYNNYSKEYKILEKGSIVIYGCSEVIHSSNGRFIRSQMNYFFSKTLDSPVLPLTVINLKRAFSDNLRICAMLDMEFGCGKDATEYYSERKTYKINYLLNQSNK